MRTNPFSTSLQLAHLSLQTAKMVTEAQMVIGMRVLGMMGMWRVPQSEMVRMVSEKGAAAGAAAQAGVAAALAGKSPVEITAAALKPVQRRTASNARRLGRRGPGKP